jgi:hypothetical protein
MHEKYRGFVSLGLAIAIIIGLAVLGGGGWYVSQELKTQAGIQSPADSAAEPEGQTHQSSTSTVTVQTSASQKTTIKVLNLESQLNKYPVVWFQVANLPANTNVAIALVNNVTGKTIWSMEDVESSLHAGVGDLDLNVLTKFDYHVEVVPGDYYLELHDFRTGKFLVKSESFHINAISGASVAIDQASLVTNSHTPTITGSATELTSIYVDIWELTPTRAVAETEVQGGVVPVVSGKWSFTVSEQFEMFRSALPAGSYKLKVYKERATGLLAEGALIVQ